MRAPSPPEIFGALLALFLAAAPVRGADRFSVREEIIRDRDAPASRRDDFLDTSLAWTGEHGQALLSLGSFAPGLELGAWLRDGRRSTYTAMLRRRQGGRLRDTALELGTDQSRGRFVGLASLRGIWPDRPEGDNLELVPSLGCEVYYGHYSFAALRIVRDPRRDTGTTFRFSNRFGWERAHLELALAPRTDGIVNYACSARLGWVVAGFARDRDFDFTRLDRRVWSIGLQYELAP